MSEFRDILKVQGVKAKGYGIVPKMVMLDRKLTIEAKAIYSYFCSYAGAGDTAFPSRDKICADLCIGKDRYYRHRDLLIKFGYISIKQVRKKNSKFSHNVYTLMDKPSEMKEEFPCPQNKDTDILPSTCFEDTGIEDTENKDTNINMSFNKINSPLYNQSFILEQELKEMERLNEILVKSEYNYLEEKTHILQAIKLLYYSEKPLNVNGMKVPLNQVRKDLQLLEFNHLQQALRDYTESCKTTNIQNHTAYLSKCIYNAIFNTGAKIKADLLRAGLI